MRTIGLDLSIKQPSEAIVAGHDGSFIGSSFKIDETAAGLKSLMERVCKGDADDESLRVIMEPTANAWLPIAIYLSHREVTCHLVQSEKAADLRAFYRKHAKSDRIDTRVLAKIPFVDEEGLNSLYLPTAEEQALRRLSRQREKLVSQASAIKNRLHDLDRLAGWDKALRSAFGSPFSEAARSFRRDLYDPWKVRELGIKGLETYLVKLTGKKDCRSTAEKLYRVSLAIIELYSPPGKDVSPYLDFEMLCFEAQIKQERLLKLEELQEKVNEQIQRISRRSRSVELARSLMGIGEKGGPVLASYVGNPHRFNQNTFRGWHGMIPGSKQSSNKDQKGVSMTKAGPNLVKKFAYLCADVARQWDPQIAHIYWDQMVNKGKHHTQAVCACATHLLDRLLAVLKEDRPYELRDCAGNPITSAEGKRIIQEKYQVPEEVRQSRRARNP